MTASGTRHDEGTHVLAGQDRDTSHFVEQGGSASLSPTGHHSWANKEFIATYTSLTLTFILLLSLWDTWGALLEIVAPLPSQFVFRISLNLVMCVVAKLLISGCEGKVKLMGNLLMGMGAWELAESGTEMAFGHSIYMKLFFYLTCLIFTFGIIIYLERHHGMVLLDKEMMS